MKKYRLLGFLPVLALAAVFAAMAFGEKRDSAVPPYVNPAPHPDQFPIIGYHSFVRDEAFSVENYRLYKEAGFNVAYFLKRNAGTTKKILDMCDSVGISAILKGSNPLDKNWANMYENSYKDLDVLIKSFGNHPALAGFSITDEPNAEQFDSLAPFVSKIYDDCPAKLAYINLFPNYAPRRALHSWNYERYVKEYIDAVNPQFVCFDNYGFISSDCEDSQRREEGASQWENVELRDNYYENLETVSRLTRKAGIPMWTFVLSAQHLNFPYPSYGQMAVQAFSGLAYGSQCIQYYGYASDTVNNSLRFRNVPFTEGHGRSAVWHSLKRLNEKIQWHAPAFLDMKLRNVWHMGKKVPSGTKRLSDSKLPSKISKVSLETDKGTDHAGVLVSHFVKGKRNYLMVLNKDVNRPARVKVTHSNRIRYVAPTGDDSAFGFAMPPESNRTQTDTVIPKADFMLLAW